MTSLAAASLINAFVASVLALVALAIAQAWRNPFVNRGVWLAVLLKFVMPPLVLLPAFYTYVARTSLRLLVGESCYSHLPRRRRRDH